VAARDTTAARWLAAPVITAVAAVATGCTPRTGGPAPGTPDGSATSAVPATAAPGTSAPTSTPPAAGQDPARFAPQVHTHAATAGVDAQLLMAILYNESYKPHDPTLERAWQRLDPNAALGVANMHEATFNEVKRGRDFAGRDWSELPDDPGLAIEAAAWYLHDLAAQLPATWPGPYQRNDLLALGYNAGPASMLAFARGARPGRVAQGYLDRLHANWPAAGRAIR
jgi:hypothetical protein